MIIDRTVLIPMLKKRKKKTIFVLQRVSLRCYPDRFTKIWSQSPSSRVTGTKLCRYKTVGITAADERPGLRQRIGLHGREAWRGN